jgi:DNA-binding transcriptional ArsR family regulator
MEQRAGKLISIKDLLKQSEDIILRGADRFTTSGFTQVPNAVLTHARISPGAKLTYALLLKYAWGKSSSFPGQEQLAKDLGGTDRSIRTYLKDLEGAGLVEIHRRGLGRPNLYILNITVPRASGSDRKIFPVRRGSSFRS